MTYLCILGESTVVPTSSSTRLCESKGIRYADPLSWAVMEAVSATINKLEIDRNKIGLITTGTTIPIVTLKRLNEDCRRGLSSPTLFPASNPSSAAGLTCLCLSLRGPSMHLACGPERALEVVDVLAQGWLRKGVVKAIIIATCSADYVSAKAIAINPSITDWKQIPD